MLVIIFSKDRPMQLDLLLESMEKYIHGSYQAIAITLGDYTDVFERHKWCKRKNQTNFHEDLISCLSYLHHKHVMFLVDDTVFVRHVYLKHVEDRIVRHDAIAYSLRLGRNINYCYMMDATQELVDYEDHDDYISFNWKIQKFDWSYPMDISSSVFNLSAMYITVCGMKTCVNPNRFESFLAHSVTPFNAKRQTLLCNQKSCAYSIPINMTQTEFTGNRHENSHSIEDLNKKWKSGEKIDLDSIPRTPNSVHMVVDVKFVNKNG